MSSEKKDNVIFIGGKPFMNYVTGIAVQFNEKESEQVIISARGKFISKAVDIAEVTKRKVVKDKKISVSKINIDSEEFKNKEGKKVNVSTIEITLKKE
jgi:DNA-binding protein